MPIPFWWMLNEMTKWLVFVLACKMGQFSALCWFWGKKCDDTTKYSTLSISFIQKGIYKKLYASARLPAMCSTLGWSLSAGYTRKYLHLGAPRNATQAEISWFWRPRYYPICCATQKCCVNVFVTQVLLVILDVEFDGGIHFYVQLALRSRSGQSKVKYG